MEASVAIDETAIATELLNSEILPNAAVYRQDLSC